MTRDDFRRRAAAVRDLPLVAVLVARGAVRDRHDHCKWHSEQGPLTITGTKFMNWSQDRGGGGAIDLVMHLANVNCATAVAWLEQQFAPGPLAIGRCLSPVSHHPSSPVDRSLRLPVSNDQQQPRVLRYLTEQRRLATAVLEPLLQVRQAVRGRSRQCGLSVGSGESQPTRRRGTAWYRSARVAWDGARHTQGSRLLLDRSARRARHRPLRVRH